MTENNKMGSKDINIKESKLSARLYYALLTATLGLLFIGVVMILSSSVQFHTINLITST